MGPRGDPQLQEATVKGIALGFLAVALSFGVGSCGKKQVQLPPKGPALVDFKLTDQSGQEVGLSTYRGKIWVAGFIFTKCPSVCPTVTRAMAGLQGKLKAASLEAELVTFTVDPETDTPAILKEYGEDAGADFDSWRFLTARDVPTMRSVVEGNFATAMGEKHAMSAGMYDIAHTTKLVLVGRGGHRRGYFSSDPAGIQRVLAAVEALSQARE